MGDARTETERPTAVLLNPVFGTFAIFSLLFFHTCFFLYRIFYKGFSSRVFLCLSGDFVSPVGIIYHICSRLLSKSMLGSSRICEATVKPLGCPAVVLE